MDQPGKQKAKKVGRNKRLAQDVAKKVEAKLTMDTWPSQGNKEAVDRLDDDATIHNRKKGINQIG